MSTRTPSERLGFYGRLIRVLRRGRPFIVPCVALLTMLIVHLVWFQSLGAIKRWNSQAYDLRFVSRGDRPANPNVVVVGITSSSLNQQKLEKDVGESEAIALMHDNVWPWPRKIHAKVIERLFQAGARVVAVDIVFAAARDGDDELAAVLEKYRDRIVLASIVQESTPGTKEFFRPNTRLSQAVDGANAVGFATVKPDPVDVVVRHFDLRTSELREFGLDDDTQDLQSFASLAVAKFQGGSVGSGYRNPLNYQGKSGTYPHLSVEEIFLKRTFEQGRTFQQGQIFKDKIVFYGPIAEILHDVHATPFGSMPGVEIHAHLAGSLLSGKSLRYASPALTFCLIILSAGAAVLAVQLVRNALWQAATIILLEVLFWVGSQLAFSFGGVIIPAVPPIFCIASTGAFGIVFYFFLEQWEKAQTRKVLNRSVNPRIAKVLLRNAEGFDQNRRGKRQPVAILFSDIRSFTTWSESAEPEHLVGQLNEYFDRMVALIEGEESMGNAQKFIGDAILAAWGDTPENQFGPAEDARRAVATALKMRTALRELNEGWAGRPDRIVISIGIGINSGDVVVGEVGHPLRGEYTVLGDGVNFAARLESATKQIHTDCLAGERVEELTREHFIFRHVDYLRVKGKTKPVNVYTLLSDRSVPAPDWLADYHRARGLYVARRFTEAAVLFREVKGAIGGEDFLCDMYAERCDVYSNQPPAEDWDGSYTMTEK